MNDAEWTEFTTFLRKVYWEALPPDLRIESRLDAAEGDPEVPDDIWQAALLVFPNVEAWLHNPVPLFKHRSPLEMIGRGQLKDVRGLIMSIAPDWLPDPSEVKRWQPGDDEGVTG